MMKTLVKVSEGAFIPQTKVSATAEGKVKADEAGAQVLVITADENTAGFIL